DTRLSILHTDSIKIDIVLVVTIFLLQTAPLSAPSQVGLGCHRLPEFLMKSDYPLPLAGVASPCSKALPVAYCYPTHHHSAVVILVDQLRAGTAFVMKWRDHA